MPPDLDPKHVIEFSLVPVGGFPDPGDRIDQAILFTHIRLYPDPVISRDRIEIVDHLEPLLSLSEEIHPAQVGKVVKQRCRVLLQDLADRDNHFLVHKDGKLSAGLSDFHGEIREMVPEGVEYGLFFLGEPGFVHI